jgi:AraC family transcriptional regulator
LGKIAFKLRDDLQQAVARRAANGGAGHPTTRILAQGNGWSVDDVVCTSGPQDRPFEEQHSRFSVAVVAAGSFQYRSQSRSTSGYELLAPGSLLLGNSGQFFECGHHHAAGDRCIAFRFTPQYFERIAADAGFTGDTPGFQVPRLPPLRAISPLIARSCAGLLGAAVSWEELSIQLAAQSIQVAEGLVPSPNRAPPSAVARVTRAVRFIECHTNEGVGLASLAGEAGLSPYHFLRTFQSLTGVTPHQFVLRKRLREAALRLSEPAGVLDIALECGFGDLSNFNHAFRAEFGISPRGYRKLYFAIL